MQVGTGFSATASSREAGAEAADQAFRSVEKPVLAFLFSTGGYDQKDVLDGVLSRAGGARVVGACGAGVLTPRGVFRQGVAVLALGGAEVFAVTALERFDERDSEETGRRLAKSLLAEAPVRGGTVFVFPDGLAKNVGRMLCGLYGAMGPDFRYVGGATGDNQRLVNLCQVTERGAATRSVAAALVWGCSFGVGLGHGWKETGAPLIITRARGRVLYELDGHPALDVYSRRVEGLDRRNFAVSGAAHPLGLVDAAGRFIIRDPVRVLPGGAVQMATDVPPRAVAFLMAAGKDDMLEASRGAASGAARTVRAPRFALVFDCVSRFLFLGEGAGEVAVIRYALGAIPFVGFLSFGEVAAYEDVPLVHNKSLVVACGGV
ncbi:MAG: FIST N-terminal domain-containing protein [Bacillota bacterium]